VRRLLRAEVLLLYLLFALDWATSYIGVCVLKSCVICGPDYCDYVRIVETRPIASYLLATQPALLLLLYIADATLLTALGVAVLRVARGRLELAALVPPLLGCAIEGYAVANNALVLLSCHCHSFITPSPPMGL